MGAGCADAGGNNTGGGSRSQLRKQHAPRGAPHDGATWMGGRPPPAGDEDEAADGGARGAEGPAGPPPHAAPPLLVVPSLLWNFSLASSFQITL